MWTQFTVLQSDNRVWSFSDANGRVFTRPAADRDWTIDERADGFGVEQFHAAVVRLQPNWRNSNARHFHLEHHPGEHLRPMRCVISWRSDSNCRWNRRREHFFHTRWCFAVGRRQLHQRLHTNPNSSCTCHSETKRWVISRKSFKRIPSIWLSHVEKKSCALQRSQPDMNFTLILFLSSIALFGRFFFVLHHPKRNLNSREKSHIFQRQRVPLSNDFGGKSFCLFLFVRRLMIIKFLKVPALLCLNSCCASNAVWYSHAMFS